MHLMGSVTDAARHYDASLIQGTVHNIVFLLLRVRHRDDNSGEYVENDPTHSVNTSI